MNPNALFDTARVRAGVAVPVPWQGRDNPISRSYGSELLRQGGDAGRWLTRLVRYKNAGSVQKNVVFCRKNRFSSAGWLAVSREWRGFRSGRPARLFFFAPLKKRDERECGWAHFHRLRVP